MRKLLYVAGTYAPGAFAGSELSAHTLLRELSARHGVDVLVLTDAKYAGGHGERRTYDGVAVHGVEHERRVSEIEAVAADFAPDAVLTQLLWSDVAMEVGARLGIPTILRVAAVPNISDLSLPSAIIASSRYAQDWIRNEWRRESYLIRPSIDLSRAMAPSDSTEPRFITMFNPVEVKGGAVFREIARALPGREFAVVPGWHSLRDATGGFDRIKIRHSWESQGVFEEGSAAGLSARVARWLRRALVRLGRTRPVPKIEYPTEVDLSDLPNVTVLEPRAEVGEIYAQTRLLLVPSQWEETFGRVAIEAFANGIPVIGSSVGGLKEHVGEAGILVEEKRDVGAWVRAIEELDAPERYKELRARGVAFIEQSYSLEETGRRFTSVLERVTASWSPAPAAVGAAPRPTIRILIPYFGAWPPWMGFFLESCRTNPSIDWLLLGDCDPLDADLPPNVRVEPMGLEAFLQLASERLGIEIGWHEPYKLCDLRLGLGEICREHLSGYDFFGWGDLDVVYGDLRRFLTSDVLEHDIVSFCADHLSGHLCLLRNDPRVVACYRDFEGWREKMEDPEYRHLDETPTPAVPLSYRLHSAESFNTPLSPKIRWTDGRFDFPKEWNWRAGILTNDKDGHREFPYLHFMHWKGGAWARECGNAHWEKLDTIVHVEARAARHGFRVNAKGFFSWPEKASGTQ